MSSVQVKISSLVSRLAEAYSFDLEDAMQNHVDMTVFVKAKSPKEPKAPKEPKEPKEKSVSPTTAEKLNHDIALWTKKLESGKIADDKKPALIEKIEKAKARMAKKETPAPAPAPVAVEKVKKTKKVAEPKSDTDEEKRLPRMTPTYTRQLTAELKNVGVELSKKVSADFKKFIEELADDDWRGASLETHMVNFAKLQVVAPPAPVVLVVEAPVKETKPKSPKAPKKETVKKVSKKAVKEEVVVRQEAIDESEPVVLTLSELQSIVIISTLGDGKYWDANIGRLVTGPTDESEEVEEIEWNGVTYAVGETTGRVYMEVDGKDKLQGFIGVGNLRDMKK
jgi:hypothetical protein